MRKQVLIIGIFVTITISAALLLHAGVTNKTANTSTNCAKTCQEKPAVSPRTGFFIFDSFSGSL
jgi:hypothetical protein